MKILWQLCFLFALCFVGEIASSLLPFPFPASVISLLILLFLAAGLFLVFIGVQCDAFWRSVRRAQFERREGFRRW